MEKKILPSAYFFFVKYFTFWGRECRVSRVEHRVWEHTRHVLLSALSANRRGVPSLLSLWSQFFPQEAKWLSSGLTLFVSAYYVRVCMCEKESEGGGIQSKNRSVRLHIACTHSCVCLFEYMCSNIFSWSLHDWVPRLACFSQVSLRFSSTLKYTSHSSP